MTKITRSVSVPVDPTTLWNYMDMRRWCEISSIFTKVDLSNGKMEVGGEAKITAGPGDEKVNYTARITVLEPGRRLAYARSGGPLPGRSEWEIQPNHQGATISYHNTFDHTLPDPVVKSMESTMERFLGDLKAAVESNSNGSK